MSKFFISGDGTMISCVDQGAGTEWVRCVPTPTEWQSFWRGNQTADSLARGIFRWISEISDDEVIVVFSPYGGLDFNLTYRITDGRLINITEAR